LKLFNYILGAVLIAGMLPTPVMAATFDAEVISISNVAPLKASAIGEVQVQVRNTGTTTWMNSGDNAVKLGTIGPRDRTGQFYHESWLSQNRVVATQEAEVLAGGVGTFVFNATAVGEGKMVEKLGLVAEGIAWFDGVEVPITLDVQPTIWKTSFVQQTPTNVELKSGEVKEVTVRFRNDGDAAWQNAGASAVKVGTAGPLDRKSSFASSAWLSPNRVGVAGTVVAPGEEGSFIIKLQAPAKTGDYTENFSLVAEGITWFDINFSVNVKVVPAIYTAEYIGQSANAVSLQSGETTALWVEYKNTGNTVWRSTGDTAAKLGTARNLDRESVFYDNTWLSTNRVATLSQDEVKPGEIGRFTFVVRAPDKVGEKFKEYFRPVIEGVTWLADTGLYFDISIDEELVLVDPIRVGLTSTTSNVTVQGTNFVIRRGSDKGLVGSFKNQTVNIMPLSFGYNVNGQAVNDWVKVIPLNNTTLTVDTTGIGSYNTFRGMILVRRSPVTNNIWVVNEVALDDYTKGIAEVPNSFPVEAQKAQMVAARTFAVKKRSDSTSRDIFDLYDDTRSQVYYGYNYEKDRPNLVAASESTKGMIIKYNNQPISAYYFSDSGGHTSNVEWVWGGNPIPYLKGVPDPWAKADVWTHTLQQSYLKSRFDDTLGISATGGDTIEDMQVTERYPSNWIKTVVFTLSSGRTIPVSVKTFDYLTSNSEVRSMSFDIQKINDFGQTAFVVTGKGWGHNIGMPQWGARNMAEAGKTYQEILTYYYTGVTVGPV
jgi:stage II sporulation protein D